ncbi:tRNA pseudouridine(55) synthase TruB [Pelagibacteraceae bacterium]|nr:tRNA pseudouridine(55) synthase TruB [Pelagibacteraceae bacterium]
MISKQGWINLYKPKNITSFKAINFIKKKFSINKIGHAGTLDPMAEGVLPIAIGKATKLIPYINIMKKEYEFTIAWGSQTTTDDAEGKILFVSNYFPTKNEIENKIINYLGYIIQIPPKVSAVKINGKRAYKLFRENETFTIEPKKVFVQNLSITKHSKDKTSFKILCGKGFYVRSFARDIALDLKTYGHISSLKRSKVGKFREKNSILLDDLLKIGQMHERINFISPTISMLDDILAYEIEEKMDIENLSFGRSIKIDEEKIINSSSINLDKKNIFLFKKGDIVSIGKLDGNLFKPNKILI